MMNKQPWLNGKLRVSENNRYLKNGSEPFFWLGDTAWLLFEHLSFEEIKEYLLIRKEQGYNVIQATLLHRSTKNIKVESFWDKVDKTLTFAEENGLYMALLPTWGSIVTRQVLSIEEIEEYADFLGNRYNDRPNLIWVVGGDARADEGLEGFNLLGSTLRSLCPDYLITYHPFGRTSSTQWFEDSEWLDFHMFQSGHRRYDQASLGLEDDNSKTEYFYGEDNWRYVEYDYKTTPHRPTIDAEPSYEEVPQGLHDTTQPLWKAHHVRRYAYWSVLEGTFGHTYGHNSVMQFYVASEEAGAYGARTGWREGLEAPGGKQMKYVKELMEMVDYQNGSQARHLLAKSEENYEKHERISVFATENHVLFYNYTGRTFGIDPEKFPWKTAKASFFDPEDGSVESLGIIDLNEKQEFESPKSKGDFTDWVLILTEA